MSSYGNLDTNNWTSGFVSTNRNECLRVLGTLISTVEDLTREKNYLDAVIGMKKVSLGLVKLDKEYPDEFDKQIATLAFMTAATAILGILDLDAPESSRRDAALQYALDMTTDPNHEMAACYLIAEDYVHSCIADLRSGAPLSKIMRKYDFPDDVFTTLRLLEQDFSKAASSSSPSSRSPSYSSPSSYSPPSPSYPPAPSPAQSAPPKKQRSGRWIAVLLALLLVGGVLFFFTSPFLTAAPPTPTVVSPELETSPENTPEPDPAAGFIFPHSDTGLIGQWELESLSDGELNYAINEIYARHGYIFRSAELMEYYGQYPWYTPTIPSDEFSVDCFNQYEQQNWKLLVDERTARKNAG